MCSVCPQSLKPSPVRYSLLPWIFVPGKHGIEVVASRQYQDPHSRSHACNNPKQAGKTRKRAGHTDGDEGKANVCRRC